MKKILFLIPNLSVGGAEKVLVNLVNNMDKEKFDITVQVLFAGGVNEKFLKPHIKYKYCYKKIFRGNSKYFCLFKPETLYKRFIMALYAYCYYQSANELQAVIRRYECSLPCEVQLQAFLP